MTTKKEQERLPQSMKAQEYACIHDLLMQYRPKDTLEVGMAHAGSTLVFCKYAKHNWGRRHVAIDPFQSSTTGSSGLGLRRINEAGYSEYLEFHEDFDYLVLPELVKRKRSFDFILLDGWHSFDYTLLDFFYADLLLRPNGIVAFHDTELPSVNKVCRFLETHKPYERISPALYLQSNSTLFRGINKIKRALSGRDVLRQVRERRDRWFSLVRLCQIRS